MGSYAENEQDAREYAELKRLHAEEQAREKPTITMDEMLDHRALRRAEENADRHMRGQENWRTFMERTNNGEDYERSDEQQSLLDEINQIVNNNILYGTPPYSLESAEDILLDIINDLSNMKERLGFNDGI